ncbi:MAG: Hpt domain-containing protein, partial [Patulibacter sp.]|nr:Hpt domain-containing protein [Patulibacter sp.]
AHRIRGASLTVGARSMARIAQQIEDVTGGDDPIGWEAVGDLSSRLGEALDTTVALSDPGPAPVAR